MTALGDYIKNQQQGGQQDNKNKERTALSNYIDKNKSPLGNYIERQNKDVSSFGFDEKTPTEEEAINRIKTAADKNERNRYGFVGDMRDSVTGLFGQLGDLAEYGWTYATNKNEDWGINDWKKYNKYSKEMNEVESEEDASDIYKKMVSEGVINEAKYNRYLDDQKKDKYYEFNQAREEGKNVFNNKLESRLSPIIKQATNRYQIDAISKGIKELEDQRGMAYDNAMNAYNDTRDPKILEEWIKTSKEYDEKIINFAEEWTKNIIEGQTYGAAYKETISDYANKRMANDIVSLERGMTNKLYKLTIDRNFNDAGEYATTGNLFQALNSTLLGAKNLITWGLQQVSFATEELKQDITGRYDVTEELANLYVFDEKANGITKTLGGAQWVGNWLLDSLPQIAPLIGEIYATRKLPGSLLKKIDKTIDATKGIEGFTRAGNRRISRVLSEVTMDNLVYDTSFQTLVGHPITGEEENLNLLFNGMIDSAQAMLHVPAKYFNNALKPEDVMNKNISAEALNLAKQLDDKNAKLLAEQLVLLRGKEITEGTAANKTWLENIFDLEELRKTEPDLVAKYEEIQKLAYDYTDRIRNHRADIDDILLAFEDMKGRKAANNTPVGEQIKQIVGDKTKKVNTLKQLGDYIFSGAKSISQTLKNALSDGRIAEGELRLAIKNITNVKGIDDLILGLIRGDAKLRQKGLEAIQASGEITKEQVNQIYNGTIIELLKSKGDILKEDEWLGKFKKNDRGEFIDVYGVLKKQNGEDVYNVYTYDEIMDYLKQNISSELLGGEKFRISDALADAYDEVTFRIKNETKLDEPIHFTDMFRRISQFDFDNFANKTVAEQTLLKNILSSNGFKIELDENKNIVSITMQPAKVKRLYERIKGLQNKGLHQFDDEDIGAYKILFFGDIYSSFKTYLTKLQIEGGNAKQLLDEFKTYFEKQFDVRDGKYTLKAIIKNDKAAVDSFKELFENNASFKEVENMAANNLIKNILQEANLNDDSDKALYAKIKELVCKGKYIEGLTDKEALPIVNSMFNQAKWMKNLGMGNEAIEEITRIFGEMIVDEKTITALSNLGSDYLYKTVISKLILENDLGTGLYRDSLIKLINYLSRNVTKENKEVINSLNEITKKINNLTLNIPDADKTVFFNRVWDAFDISDVKLSKEEWNSAAVKINKGIYNIPDPSKMTDGDIDNLSTLIATSVFYRNHLPNSKLLDRLKASIKNSLENARNSNRPLKFSIGQTLEETEGINLSLLGDMQLAQLLKNPDNMLQAIISKWHIQRKLDNLEMLPRKVGYYNKERKKKLKFSKIGNEYRNIITGLKGLFEGGFDKDVDELIDKTIDLIEENGINDLGNVRNMLVALGKKAKGSNISTRINKYGKELDYNIEKIEDFINLLNAPGNSKRAEAMAAKLEQVKALMERGKVLLTSGEGMKNYESNIAKSFDDVSHLGKQQFNKFNGVVNDSETVQSIWDMGRNEIFYDSPYKMKWKGLEGKKFVILDTETTGLEDDAKVIQLSYRVVQVQPDGAVKMIGKPRNEYYKWPEDMSKWAKENAEKNGLQNGKEAFGKNSELYKELEEFAKEDNTYFVGHNIQFDFKRMGNGGIKLPEEKAISTDLISTALIPVGIKNHKQETIVEMFQPIKEAVTKMIEDEKITGITEHNAIIDTLELESVLGYLINHAIKNGKATEENLFDFLMNVSQKMSKEKRSANALPFYNFESRWDYQKFIKNKYSGYAGRNMAGVSDWTFDMSWLLNQMFGSNNTRRDVGTFLEEFNAKFPNSSKELNIYDTIDGIADKLGDEKSLFILNNLKKYIDEEDVIEANKIYLGEEVKDAYIKFHNINPEVSFPEYCTNRIVANILASKGMYNEDVIRELNNELALHLQDIAKNKLIYNGIGTLDTEAFIVILNDLNDKGLINLGERGSGEYSRALTRILEKVRGTKIKKAETGVTGDTGIYFTKDGLTFALSEFNKELYQQITKGDNAQGFAYAAADLFKQLFGDEVKQGDVIVFEGGLFPEYAVKRVNAQMVADKSMPVEKLTPEEIDEVGQRIIGNKTTNEFLFIIDKNKTYETWKDIYDELDNITDKLDNLKTRWTASRTNNSKKLIDINAQIEELKNTYAEGKITSDEFNSIKQNLEALKKEFERKISMGSKKNTKLLKVLDELQDEMENIDEMIDRGYGRTIDVQEYVERKLNQFFDDAEDAAKEILYDEEEKGVVKEGIDVYNRHVENPEAVGTARLQSSSVESQFSNEFAKMADDPDFDEKIFRGDTLLYDNKFLIDETEDSVGDLNRTSLNGIVYMLARGNNNNKQEMIKYLQDEYDKTAEELEKLEGDYKKVLKYKTKYGGKIDDYKKRNKEVYENYETYIQKNSKKSFLYNALNIFKGGDASMNAIKLSENYGFGKELIGAKTHGGTIKRIDINIKIGNDVPYAKQIFGDGAFTKDGFMDAYADALNGEGKNKYIIVNYTLDGVDGKEHNVTDKFKVNDLFDTPFGQYILKEYGIPLEEVPKGEWDNTLPAISAIKNKMQKHNQDPRWNLFRQWSDNGKQGPWYDWNTKIGDTVMPDEQIWMEGIGYSDKKYAYIYYGLNERQKGVLNDILGDDDIETYISKNGTRKIDELINEAGFDSAEELIYKKVVLPAAKEGKKNMKDWRTKGNIKTMMKDIVMDKSYKRRVDRAYKTPTAFYKLDNYIFKNDKSLVFTVQHDKILAFRTEENGKKLKVIGYEPQFYRVNNEMEVDPAVVEMKKMNGEYVPDDPNDLGKEVVAIIYPGEYISTKEERSELLRKMDIDNSMKSDGNGGTLRSEYRDTFEYVHDMDEVKVLVEDEVTGQRYEGVLEIKRFQKTTDENGVSHTQPGMMRLKNLEESESKGKVSPFEKVKVKNEERRKAEDDQPVGSWQQMDWENSGHELRTKKVDDEVVREMEENSGVVKVPTETKEVIAEDNKHIDDDGELILNNNPLADKDKEIWNTRLLNFTNYDIVEESDELKQIVGLRNLFISQHGKDLRKAVDEFNDIIKNYSEEDQEKIYNAIRTKAGSLVGKIDNADRNLNPGEVNMEVNGLPSELQNKLNAIGQVFHDGGWNPQYQYLMLDFKNDGFEGILKNIGHNHKGAAVEYRRATGENLKSYLTSIARRYLGNNEKQVKHLVEDILGDPLGTGTMNKMLMGIRSMWRFIKYGPILYPLSGVMMLANSALLGVIRYGGESKGFRGLMNTDAFKILTAPKGETIKLSNGKTAVGLGFTDALNRTNEIMFNSNSDLGGSWFDKTLDLILKPLPEGRTKNIITTAMKGGTHSLFDLTAQGSVKTMEFAKALEKNLVGWGDINQFLKAVADGTVEDSMIRNILADTEKGYSRFFTNSATTLFSRHRFSRLYMFNALQGYVINRTDEIFSSIKDAVNWIGKRGGNFEWNDFTNYLHYDNQELKGLLMNVLLSAKLGFYMDRLVNGGEFNGKEYSDYMIDTSDYLSSIPATFFYGILTAPLTGIEDYAEYVKMNNTNFNVGDGLTVAGLNTISEVFSKFFREGKVLNAMLDSIVAFGKTGNIDFSYDVLESEFSNIANGLGRFQLAEGTHKYGLDYMNEQGDILGKILLNSDKTSESGRLQDKLYSLQTVDGILNGENGDWWKNRLLPYIPVLGNILQNSITGQGYTFTQAKWKKLQHIMDKDPTVQLLNNWDLTDKNYGKDIWRNDTYSDEAIGRLYKELTAFDYPNKQRLNGTEFKTGYEGELEQIKETVFTDEILRGLGWEEKDLMNYLNSAGDRKKAGLAKIMAAAEASRPGSSKIVLSYLANQEEYNLLKQVTKKDYPSSNDVTSEEMAEIQRQVLEDYYPYMFLADKTSWYKAITEYVSGHFDIFDNLYKDDDMTGYLSTLGYMDMIMYQQARDGNVNAKYIKNSWTMLSKYFKSEEARMLAIDYVMHSIENSGMSRGRAASAKMGVLAANMDFYNKIQKNGMMNILYGDDIERYNWYVWGVLDDINKQGLNLSSENKKYSGNKYYKPYDYQNGLGENNVPMAKQFVPAAQKYLKGRTPNGGISSYTPTTYRPGKDFNWYRRYYEGLIKDYSDRLVKSTGKKYPAEGTEKITFKTQTNNRGSIKGKRLEFPKHKSKEYRTKLFSNLPGSHG